MKKCFKCGKEKPLSEFYKHNQMGDGFLNKCKECTKKDVSDRSKVLRQDSEWVLKERARGRNKYNRLYKGLSKPRNSHTNREWRNRNKEKYSAHITLNNAINRGKILRQGCSVCGAKAQAHHFDYSNPLAIVWYCAKHHARVHRYMRHFKDKYKCNFIPSRIR